MDRGLRDNVGYLQHYCGINTTLYGHEYKYYLTVGRYIV